MSKVLAFSDEKLAHAQNHYNETTIKQLTLNIFQINSMTFWCKILQAAVLITIYKTANHFRILKYTLVIA